MSLKKIEEYLFKENVAHLLKTFDFRDTVVTIKLIPVETRLKEDLGPTLANFSEAVIQSIWHEPNEALEWPLDIIGFDCYPHGSRWRFVLNCADVEWIWESEWPTKSTVIEGKES